MKMHQSDVIIINNRSFSPNLVPYTKPLHGDETERTQKESFREDEDHFWSIRTTESLCASSNRGRPACALKKLSQDLEGGKLAQTTTDLPFEVNVLVSLDNPNKMRGTTIGERESSPIVQGRPCMTLQDKMADWKKYENKRKYRLLKKVARHRHPSKEEQLAVQAEIYREKLHAVYDIAQALRRLADKRIIYRDLNSANVGFDEYGILRLFKDPDMTSSESSRYLDPEVIQRKDRGADVYSFGILVWEIMSNHQQAFSCNKAEKLANQKRKRPNLNKMITNKKVLPQGSQLYNLVNQCCSHDPRDRPSIETVCKMIESEIALLYCDTIQR